MNKFAVRLLTFIFLLSLSSCYEKDESLPYTDWDVNSKTKLKDEVADRTVVIYMVGNNNLSGECKRNINSLVAGLSDSDCRPNVLVYEDSRANDYCSVLWDITKDKNGEVVVNELWREYDQNSAKAETMAAVFNDGT